MEFSSHYYNHLRWSFHSTTRSLFIIGFTIIFNFFINCFLLIQAAIEIRHYLSYLNFSELQEINSIYYDLSLTSFFNKITNQTILLIIAILVFAFDVAYLLVPFWSRNHDFNNEKKKLFKYLFRFFSDFYDVFYFRIFNTFALHILTKLIIDNYLSLNAYLVLSIIILIFHLMILFNYFAKIKLDLLIMKDHNPNKYPYDSFSSKVDSIILLTTLCSRAFINSREEIGISQDIRMFFAFITVIFATWSTIILFINICLQKSYVVPFTNIKINFLRFFGITFSTLMVLFYLFSNMEENLFITVLTHFSSAFVSIAIWRCMYWHQLNQIIFGKNYIFKMLYIISSISDNKNSNLLFKLYTEHLHSCKSEKTKCKLCLFILDETPKGNEILKKNKIKMQWLELFFSSYEVLQKTILHNKLNIEELHQYEFIRTYIKFNKIKKNNYLLSFHYMSEMPELQRKSPEIADNLMFFYKNVWTASNQSNQNMLFQIRTIEMKEKLSENIESIISLYIEWLQNKELVPTLLIQEAKSLYKLKQRVKKRLLVAKGEANWDYMLIIMKYIYESLFEKQKLNMNLHFNIDIYSDSLSNNYANDNFLIMKYVFENDVFNIIRASANWYPYLNQSFTRWFPLKSLAQKELISVIKSNGCILEMPIYNTWNSKNFDVRKEENWKEEKTICPCKMWFKVYPSMNSKDFLVYCLFKTNYSSAIITKYNPITKEEYINNYSSNLLNSKFFIHPKWINNNNNKGIRFNEIFKEENTNEDKWKVNYITFFARVKSIIDEKRNKEGCDEVNTEIWNTYQMNSGNAKVEEMYLQNKQIVPSENSELLYCIYYFDKEKNKKDKKEDKKDNLFNFDNKVLFTKELQSTYLINSGSALTKQNNNSASGSYTNSLGSVNNMELQKQLEEDRKKKKSQVKKFSLFSIFIFVFNFCIIIYTIVFLYIEIYSNNTFKQSFILFQEFHKYLRVFMHGTISFFYHLCPSEQGSDKCLDHKIELEDELRKNVTLDPRFSINEYIFDEWIVKMKYFTINWTSLKSLITKSYDEKLIKLSDTEVPYRYLITYNQEKLETDTQTVTFFYAVNWYLGLLYSIMADSTEQSSLSIPLNILNVNGARNEDIFLDNIVLNKNLQIQNKQIEMYGILFNYRILLAPFNDMAERIRENLLKDVSNLQNTSIFFIAIWIVFHVVLLTSCFMFAKLFKDLLNQHCIEVGMKINNKHLVKTLLSKVFIWKQMNKFYEEEPIYLVTKVNDLRAEYQSTVKTRQIEANKLKIEGWQAAKKLDFKSDTYNQVLKPSKIIITISYSLTLIFTIIFLFIFIFVLTNYNTLVIAYNDNSTIDYKIFNAFSVFQVMLLLNQTNQQIYEYYYDTEGLSAQEKVYILVTIKETYSILSVLEKSEGIHQSLWTPLRNIMKLDCQNVYQSIKATDMAIYETVIEPKYDGIDVYDQLTKICEYYKLLIFENDKMWIKNILFRISSLNINLNEHTYTELYETTNSEEIFDIYLIILLTFRPIRHYEHTEIFVTYIDDITNQFEQLMYFYLIINILIELLLMMIIRIYVIGKYKNINKSMNLICKTLKV